MGRYLIRKRTTNTSVVRGYAGDIWRGSDGVANIEQQTTNIQRYALRKESNMVRKHPVITATEIIRELLNMRVEFFNEFDEHTLIEIELIVSKLQELSSSRLILVKI